MVRVWVTKEPRPL